MKKETDLNQVNAPKILEADTKTRTKYSERRRVVKVFFGRKVAVVGLVIIVLLVLTAIFADWLAPYDPNEVNFSVKFQQPNPDHWLGTDSVGRDILSRIIYGSRTSLMVGIGAVGIAALIGQSLGLIAAYYGGIIYAVIMRCIDALMAVPMMLNAFVIASVLGGGINNVIIALGIGMISGQCRMMCAQVMTVKQNDYVLAGRAMGVTDIRMMLSEIFPNAFPPLLVMITIGLGASILAEAGLSFLGIGVVPPTPAWGSMINDGYKFLLVSPIISFAPGVAIMLTVFGFNMMGDGLRDALDPRLRGII
jgi:ABC-type dipeptide/oligopeptide/nickel transport system permease subunit